MEQQVLPLYGAMNQDSHIRYVRSDDGEVLTRYNLRPNSIDGNRYLNEKVKGNLLIPATLPDGENLCVGIVQDMEHDAIIYLIYNENLNHCVLRYYQKTKTIERVWYSEPALGLANEVITGFVAEGMLYWCNGDGVGLKSCHIEKSVNYTNWLETGVTTDPMYTDDDKPLDENIFHMEKRPPQYAPEVEYVSLDLDPVVFTPINYNNLRKKLFQFKYCYVYDDNQESAWSPISQVPLPDNEITYGGEWGDDINVNNGIRVYYNSGSSQVKRIRVAARECSDRSALGDFFTYEEIEKFTYAGIKNLADDTVFESYFLNNRKLESINTEINNRYYDDVPLAGRDMILLDGKYAAISMPTIGYDLIDVNYALEPVREVIDFDVNIVQMVVCTGYCYGYSMWRIYITIPETAYPGATYTISFDKVEKIVGGTTIPYSFSLDYDDYIAGYPNSMALAFCGVINAGFGSDLFDTVPDDPDSPIGLNTIECNYHIGYTIENVSAFIQTATADTNSVYKSLKRGQYHPFAIVYNDGFGRYNIAQGKTELFSPWVDCTLASDNTSVIKCKATINNEPPDWAVAYRWSYVPNKTYSWFIQLAGVEIVEHDSGDYDWSDLIPAGKYMLLINQAIQRLRDNYPNTVIADYVWQNGDRVKGVFFDDNSYEILSEITLDTGDDDPEGNPIYITGYLIDADINTGTCEGAVTTTTTTVAGGIIDSGTLIEIYRPAVSLAGNIFYEIGEEYAIEGGVHKGGEQDQIIGVQPAITTLDFGDVYFRLRNFYDIDGDFGVIPVEDMNFSDYYISSGISLGRVTARIDSEQKILCSIMRGENYIEDTKLNRLNVFVPGTTRFDASKVYGDITGIVEMGGTLKVIQEHKETSIMIGEVTAKYADMGDWIFIGDSVFGASRRYPENRGSIYRRSIAANVRDLYYFDEATGEFIRSSPNGQIPISKDYNMQNWFEKKAKELREYDGEKDVIVAFNNDYEEVFISFIIGYGNETLVFSEKEGNKGWLYFIDYCGEVYCPENIGTYKDTMVAFMQGQLYLHNEGSLNTFFGETKDCSLSFSVNKLPIVSKRFASINIASTKNIWNAYFSILENVNYKEQFTVLKPTVISMRENMLYSDMPRNILDRAGNTDYGLYYTGERMVGEAMEVLMTNSGSDEVLLGNVIVNFEIAK